MKHKNFHIKFEKEREGERDNSELRTLFITQKPEMLGSNLFLQSVIAKLHIYSPKDY